MKWPGAVHEQARFAVAELSGGMGRGVSGLPSEHLVVTAARGGVGRKERRLRYIFASKELRFPIVDMLGGITVNEKEVAARRSFPGPDDTYTAVARFDLDVGEVVSDTHTVSCIRAELKEVSGIAQVIESKRCFNEIAAGRSSSYRRVKVEVIAAETVVPIGLAQPAT